ncbi:MAG: NTP transferase domain-containing protein [Myxococcota bacterium]
MIDDPTQQRTGVILAAGFGSRLSGISDETTLKPLTPVAGRPLLFRTIENLDLAGCDRVVVVVGHGAEEVREETVREFEGHIDVVFVRNDDYDLANGVSVLAARPHVPGDFVLTMADHVIDEDVMHLAAAHAPPTDGATLLVDRKLESIFDMDDATKVLTDGDRIARIGKGLVDYDAVDTGLFVCTSALMEALDAVFSERGDASLSDGIQTLAERGTMRVLDIGDGFWQDVDTPAMLRHAEQTLREREAERQAAVA